MKKAINKWLILGAALCLTVSFSMLSFASEWKQDDIGWWYVNDDGGYTTNNWQVIDCKQYYFDDNGYMLHDTTTPDGYLVGSDGAWIPDDSSLSQSANSELNQQTDIELMLFKPLEYYDYDILTDFQNKKGLEISNGMVSVKEWIYACGRIPFDYEKEAATPMRLLRITSDWKTVETVAEFSLPDQYEDISDGLLKFALQGKIYFSITQTSHIDFSYAP